MCIQNMFIQQISQLQAQVATAQDQLLPKKKFAFKSRPRKATPAKSSHNPTPPSSSLAAAAASTPSPSLGAAEAQSGFRGREKELLTLPVSLPLWWLGRCLSSYHYVHVVVCCLSELSCSLQSSEIRSRDLNLSDLKECEVKLFGCPVTLHMRNMENCWLDSQDTVNLPIILCIAFFTVCCVALCPALCSWTTAKTAHL